MEVIHGIHVNTVGESRFIGVYPPNVYLMLGKDMAILVDTGFDSPEEYKIRDAFLASLGSPPLSHIILTHRHLDHMGGAAHFHQLSGGMITCSSTERDAINSELRNAHVGQIVEDGEILNLGDRTLEFIHTPGHTDGSLCILIQGEGVLFTGDTVLGTGSTTVNPQGGSMVSYLASLKKLQAFNLNVMLPGHGPLVWEPKVKLRGLIDHRLEREAQILSILHQGPKTIGQLFDDMYSELAPGLHRMARSQIQAHLIKLMEEHRADKMVETEEFYAIR